MSKRARLSPELSSIRETSTALIPILEAHPDWYASIYVERKSVNVALANLKQTQLSDQVSLGAVLRIYNGFTLFEQATDEVSADGLHKTASDFVARVKAAPIPKGAVKRVYAPATWKERMAVKLENEITNQIPVGVTASTQVHFGSRYSHDPKTLTAAQVLERLGKIVQSCRELAPRADLRAEDLTYLMARQSFSEEESLFIDRESNLSQTLFRMALTIVAMSGPDRAFIRTGGLGGTEVTEISDSRLVTLLQDLKSLKGADRLSPGKYRVLFGPVLTGVLAHEAFGHSQEGDTCARGRSKAWELHKTDTIVGNEHATILNNPAIFENGTEEGVSVEGSYGAWGSYFFDEEGWLAQEQVLLDRGHLKAPMTNLTSAIRLGVPRTANGKRESWANGVYTRQTNTYFSPGDKTLSELMKELGDGFVATTPAGGMEDPKGMGIQVGISFLQEVKGGKLTGRVLKGPAGGDIQMTGYTPDVLNSIVAKSKIEFHSKDPDSAKHPFNDAGGCGKYHKEFVNAGCGGPYVLLDQVILG